jgi:hypothetical protein
MARDIEKVRAARRRWYERNAEKAKKKTVDRKHELRAWLSSVKSDLKCSGCPETHIACLDFHHENPEEKDLCVSTAIQNGWSKERIMKEIEKCIVLCSNCHRKLHWKA